ncbi:MAG: CRISPR-associated protein Csx20 [Desulfomonilaceae bacterium]
MNAGALFILFNHTLTVSQEADARQSLGVAAIISPPPEISRLWADIPPESDSLTDYLTPIYAWLTQEARPGDYVLIQGEFGATWLMVNQAMRLGLIPIYSTTRRVAEDVILPNGVVETRHRFAHVRFRRYGT